MSDRLEREIEEILGKIEQFPAPESRRARARRRLLRRAGTWISERQQAVMLQLARISISQMMLVAFLMILGSFFFRRFSPVLMQWVLYAGIVLFISSFAILIFSRRTSSRGVDGRWRGRPVQYHYRSGLSTRVRRWFLARRAPRR